MKAGNPDATSLDPGEKRVSSVPRSAGRAPGTAEATWEAVVLVLLKQIQERMPTWVVSLNSWVRFLRGLAKKESLYPKAGAHQG